MISTNGNGLKSPNKLDTKEFGLSSFSIDSSTVVMVLMVILFLIFILHLVKYVGP